MQDRNYLARFKKRKSKPTTGSKDGRAGAGSSSSSPPPPSSSAPPPSDKPAKPSSSAPPPSQPDLGPTSGPLAEAETSEKDRKLNTLFWMRVALAIIAGTAATFVFDSIEGEDRRWASIGFMIIVFFATVIVAKGMKMQLPSSDRKKIVTQALGSYVFLYLFTWIVTYTLVNLESVQNGINF